MTQIPFKAVAVDMDGTFMDSNLKYDHERFDRLLTQLKKRHIHFIVSSGRPLARLKADFKDFLNRIDMVAENGALLVKDNQIISGHYLTQRTGNDLINYVEESYPQFNICVSGLEHSYYLQSAPNSFKRIMNFYYPNNVELNNFRQIPASDRIIKLTLQGNAKYATEMENTFNRQHLERIHCTTSGFDDIDVVAYGVNKAQGLKYFLRFFDLSANDLIAFGDGMNDKEMLELAGLSYAMANGDPEIIKLAQYTAPSNDESGVMQVLEKYLQ